MGLGIPLHLPTIAVRPRCVVRCPLRGLWGLGALTALPSQQVHKGFHLLSRGASTKALASFPSYLHLLLPHRVQDCCQEL